jgi:hypothetical protein
MIAVSGQEEEVVKLYRVKAVGSALALVFYAVATVEFAAGYWYFPSKIANDSVLFVCSLYYAFTYLNSLLLLRIKRKQICNLLL